MEFIIAKIEPKRKHPRNPFHSPMLNRECDIIHLEKGYDGRLMIDMPYDPGNPHRFVTTTVQEILEVSGGIIVFETENTVYTLISNDKNDKNEENNNDY